jgi:queuosine precursor transporter
MFLLILSGSILTWLINRSAAQIALASMVAFIAASIVDSVTYQVFIKKPKLIKINSSNLFSSAVDSIIFPTLAFGTLLPVITVLQFLAKFIGGFIWSLILNKAEKKV